MRRLVLLLTICLSFTAAAQDFRILFVNTGTIRIGGTDLSAGDVFSEADKIEWADAKQAMKVLSMSNNRQYILTSADFNERKLKSIKDYLVKSNRMSTRGAGSLSSLSRQLGDNIYVLGATSVAIDYVPDESEFFYLVRGDRRFELPYQEGCLLLNPELWDGEDPVAYDLYFHFADGEETCVSEDLNIIPLPEAVQTKRKRRR